MTSQVTLKNSDIKVLKSVTFTASATSGEADLQGEALVGIVTPSGLVGTTLSLYACDVTGGTFIPVVDSTNTAIKFTVDSSAKWRVASDQLAGMASCRFIKLVSGSSETAEVKLITRTLG
jgi:hypothetical protein